MSEIVERINRGARLLDEKVPGWVDKINLETFNMRFSGKCVASQANNSSFHTAMRDWNITEAAYYAFNFDGHKITFGDLNREWRAYILNRRNSNMSQGKVADEIRKLRDDAFNAQWREWIKGTITSIRLKFNNDEWNVGVPLEFHGKFIKWLAQEGFQFIKEYDESDETLRVEFTLALEKF